MLQDLGNNKTKSIGKVQRILVDEKDNLTSSKFAQAADSKQVDVIQDMHQLSSLVTMEEIIGVMQQIVTPQCFTPCNLHFLIVVVSEDKNVLLNLFTNFQV